MDQNSFQIIEWLVWCLGGKLRAAHALTPAALPCCLWRRFHRSAGHALLRNPHPFFKPCLAVRFGRLAARLRCCSELHACVVRHVL